MKIKIEKDQLERLVDMLVNEHRYHDIYNCDTFMEHVHTIRDNSGVDYDPRCSVCNMIRQTREALTKIQQDEKYA